MLASIDRPVLFQASVSHSMAHCTGEHGIHNPNKPNTAPDKQTNTHGCPQTRTSPNTQTLTLINTVARPAEAGKVLRCAYERVRGARFLHKPLSTRCATFVTKGGLGHALKLSAALSCLSFHLQTASISAPSLPVTLKKQQDASHPLLSDGDIFT